MCHTCGVRLGDRPVALIELIAPCDLARLTRGWERRAAILDEKMELSRNDRSLRTAAWQSVCYSSECYMHDPTIVAALFLRDDGLVNFDNLCVA